MAQWFVTRGGEEKGPFSDQRLKKLAVTGQLRPDDLVRRNDHSTVKMAREVKGLFSSDPPPASAPKSPARAEPTSKSGPSLWERTGLIATLVVFCFPVGLFLIWRHPRWTQKQKWLWSGAVGVVFIVSVIGQTMERQEVERQLTEANRLWDIGDRAVAVAKYRPILDEHFFTLKDDEKSLLYGRVIDFDADSGNLIAAKELLSQAESRHIVPAVSSEKARALIAARNEERQEQERQEKARSGTPQEQLQAADWDELIGAAVLYNKYAGNEAAGDATYKGETIFVEGEVVNVEKSGFAGTSLNLAHRTGLIGVRCFLTDAATQSAELTTVRPGSWVKVRGVCQGLTLGGRVHLDDCEFVVVNR